MFLEQMSEEFVLADLRHPLAEGQSDRMGKTLVVVLKLQCHLERYSHLLLVLMLGLDKYYRIRNVFA
jgi:hypothetical protein